MACLQERSEGGGPTTETDVCLCSRVLEVQLWLRCVEYHVHVWTSLFSSCVLVPSPTAHPRPSPAPFLSLQVWAALTPEAVKDKEDFYASQQPAHTHTP